MQDAAVRGPDFVILSYQSLTPVSRRRFAAALCETTNKTAPGIVVTRQKEGTAFLFDQPCSIAVASLIHQGVDPDFAAALVYADIVCAVPDDEGLVPEPPEEMVWQIDRVHLEDGSSWTVFGDVDIVRVRPEQLDRTGYCVAVGAPRRDAATVSQVIAKAIHSDQHEHRIA